MQSDHACAVQTHIRALFLTLVFRPQKMQRFFHIVTLGGGIHDTSEERGELGGTREAARASKAPKAAKKEK